MEASSSIVNDEDGTPSELRFSTCTDVVLPSNLSENNYTYDNCTPTSVVQPLLTDLYQISMAYAYWKNGRHQEMAVFDLVFRKNRK
jgi:hypothetical protein